MVRSELPIHFEGLSDREIQVHLRHCAAVLSHCDFVDLQLGEAGAVIPVIKRIRRVKTPVLDFALRADAIGRDALGRLGEQLRSDGYRLTTRLTAKRRLLSKISVPLPIEDAMFPATGVAILAAVAAQLGKPWPQPVSASYRAMTNTIGLPGDLAIDDPDLRRAREIGRAIGAGIGFVLGRR